MPTFPPPRWLEYDPVGSPIPGSRILPVKLPIPKEKCYNISREKWFTDNDLLNYCSDRGYPLLGIIDTTFTNYYDQNLYTSRNVMYEKIFVKGHVIPSDSTVNAFIAAVQKILNSASSKQHFDNQFDLVDGVVAVHCTHGVNRTGYLVCRYLIDVLGWPAEEAISNFESARGYPIERDNYLEDLRKR